MDIWIIAKLKQKRKEIIDPYSAYVSSVLSSPSSHYRGIRDSWMYFTKVQGTHISFQDLVRITHTKKPRVVISLQHPKIYNSIWNLVWYLLFHNFHESGFKWIKLDLKQDSIGEQVETSENILAPALKCSAENSSVLIAGFYEINSFYSSAHTGIHFIFLPYGMVTMHTAVCVCVHLGLSVRGECT